MDPDQIVFGGGMRSLTALLADYEFDCTVDLKYTLYEGHCRIPAVVNVRLMSVKVGSIIRMCNECILLVDLRMMHGLCDD